MNVFDVAAIKWKCADELERILQLNVDSYDGTGAYFLTGTGLRQLEALVDRWRGTEEKAEPSDPSPFPSPDDPAIQKTIRRAKVEGLIRGILPHFRGRDATDEARGSLTQTVYDYLTKVGIEGVDVTAYPNGTLYVEWKDVDGGVYYFEAFRALEPIGPLPFVELERGSYEPPRLRFEEEPPRRPRILPSLTETLSGAGEGYVFRAKTQETLHALRTLANDVYRRWLVEHASDSTAADWIIEVATSESRHADFPGLEGVGMEKILNLRPTDVLLLAVNRKLGRTVDVVGLEALATGRTYLPGVVCSVCGGWQWRSSGGVTCDEGHGGAESKEVT